MVAADENALRCDFAETYRVFDWRALPARPAAVLACGLRDGSRIKMALAELPAPVEVLLLARILDQLRLLVWQNTEDGVNGVNQPTSVLSALVHGEAPAEAAGFDSPAEFDAWRSSMIGE